MSPDPVWVDGSTPLNSVNMTKLQTRDEKGAPSGYVGLDSGSNANVAGVFASGYGGARQVTLSSSVIPSGYAGVAFGSTGDTNLYRAAVNDLRTDGSFMAGTHVQSAGGGATGIMLNGSDGKLYFGGAGDTILYRQSTNQLRTSGQLDVGASLWLYGSSPILFGSAADTNLYRYTTAMLRTDSYFLVANKMAVDHGGTGAKLFFGNAEDTSLYRVVAGFLKTDGHFQAAQNIYVNLSDAANGGIIFGSAGDTNLYRSGAGILTTGNAFTVGSYLQVSGPMWSTDSTGDLWHGLLFGSAQDTKLYRSGAGSLRTDGQFTVGTQLNVVGATGFQSTLYINDSAGIDGNTPYWAKYGALSLQTNSSLRLNGGVYVDLAGMGQKLYFGASADATLYRYGANTLSTPGFLRIDGAAANGGSSSGLLLTFGIYGARWVDVGGPDSGGAGYRQVIVAN